MTAVRATQIDINVFGGGTRRTLTCARSLAASVIMNDAVCVRVVGARIATYEIAEVVPSTFASAGDEIDPLRVAIIPDDIRYA